MDSRQTWSMDLENKIYSLVKAEVIDDLTEKYPTITFTTNNESTENATFPTVYIHELEGIEKGITLERDSIESVVSTFEVKVTVNTDKEDAKKIMKYILSAFKTLRYNATSLPISTRDANMYISVGRFRRYFSSEDVISL